MNTAYRWIGILAGILGLTGVALGAFGAHALKATLLELATLPIWQTAVLYHLIHSVALLAVAGRSAADRKLAWAAGCWAVGILFFSGSLYGLALGGPKFLGPITPLGGIAFLLGWSLVAWQAFRSPKP